MPLLFFVDDFAAFPIDAFGKILYLPFPAAERWRTKGALDAGCFRFQLNAAAALSSRLRQQQRRDLIGLAFDTPFAPLLSSSIFISAMLDIFSGPGRIASGRWPLSTED